MFKSHAQIELSNPSAMDGSDPRNFMYMMQSGGPGENQLPEGYQNAGDSSGLTKEYLKLQEDFMKWQQQLLQNQQVLHSRVAPIAAQPPTMNNMGVFRDMLNHSSQPMPNMAPQQQQQPQGVGMGGPRRPIEINIPIRMEGEEDVPDNSSRGSSNFSNANQPQSSRWNTLSGAPNVPDKHDFVLVSDPPQVFQAPTDPNFVPLMYRQQPPQPKEPSPPPRGHQWAQPKMQNYQQPSQQNFVNPPSGVYSQPQQQPQTSSGFNRRSPPQTMSSRYEPQTTHTETISSAPFMDNAAARQAFWRDSQNQRSSPASETLQTHSPQQQRQKSPFQAPDRRQQMPSRSPEKTASAALPDDNMNARFTSVVTLNDRNNKDANKDKVRSVVQLNNVESEPRPTVVAPTVRGFKLPQEPPTQEQPPTPTTVHNARARPWANRSGSGDRAHPASNAANVPQEYAAPMSSRLVQAVQQPNIPSAHIQNKTPSPPRVSPLKTVERKSPSPIKNEPSPPPPHPSFPNVSLRHVETRISPPKGAPIMMSSAPEFQEEPSNAPMPPPPPPPSSIPGPPPPPPPPMMPADRRTSTGKKIISCKQDQPDLDQRAELMMAIRQFGGSQNLRRKNAGAHAPQYYE